MKKSFPFLFALMAMATTIHAATLVVNNNPGAPTGGAVYSNFAAAISAATAGDIIYMVPSSTSYGDLTINKSVTVFGAGLEPDKDLSIKTFVNVINITASDVRVSGLITSGNHYWYIGNGASNADYVNITIENCRFRNLNHTVNSNTVGNLLLRNNVINAYFHPINLEITSNVIITNNVINFSSASNYGLITNGGTFTHNIFRHHGINGSDGLVFDNVDNSFFEFNIFYGTAPNLASTCTGNTLDNNVSYNSNVNTFIGLDVNSNSGTGNLEGVNPDFTNFPLGTGWSGSFDLSLGASTGVTNINSTGVTAGVTGGATPWDPDGSLLPTVQSISIPSVIPVGSDLNVNVTGKGN